MASVDNLGSSHPYSGSSDSSANAGTVSIYLCATGFRYSLSMLEVIFLPPNTSWVCDHNLTLEPRFTKFSSQDATKEEEPKAFEIISSVTSGHLLEFRSLYNIPQDYELIPPFCHEQVNTPCTLRVFHNL